MIEFLANQTPLLYLTQSFWRDEAFTVLLSEQPLTKIVSLTALDFNPPFYYFILHFWMKIFGQGEVVLRLLSFIFHLFLVYTVYKFAQKIFKSSFFVFLLTFLTFANPMLLYYAFEVRMYSLLAFLATASMYFFYIKSWPAYMVVTSLGLWTQPFMVLVVLSQVVYLFLRGKFAPKKVLPFLTVFLLWLPWLPALLNQFLGTWQTWIWPINQTTVTTILGNLFTGYEGTPWDLWQKMTILSLVILALAFLARHLLFWLWLFLPVGLTLAISAFKPTYVNRYLIFASVAELFLIVLGISQIKSRPMQKILALSFLLFTAFFNFWFPPLHQKQDLRATLTAIKRLVKPTDLVLSKTPLTFFEANYYFPDRSRVFLYNPERRKLPVFLGSALIPKEKMADTFPRSPSRAFLIHDNGNFEVVSQR